MLKTARITFSDDAESCIRRLSELSETSKVYQSILNSVQTKLSILQSNLQYGDHIKQSLVPQVYEMIYGVKSLYRVELSSFWRLLYTLFPGEDSGQVVVFIVDILDHSTYDKKFGYRKM